MTTLANANIPRSRVAETAARKRRWVTIISILVLLLVLGGAEAILLVKMRAHNGDEDKTSFWGNAQREETPVFVRFDPIIVNLQTDEGMPESYLQLAPQLKALNTTASEMIQSYKPEIRDKILLLLMEKKASDLSTPQDISKLSSEIRDRVNEVIDGERTTPLPGGGVPRPDDSVQSVLFTSFIIQ